MDWKTEFHLRTSVVYFGRWSEDGCSESIAVKIMLSHVGPSRSLIQNQISSAAGTTHLSNKRRFFELLSVLNTSAFSFSTLVLNIFCTLKRLFKSSF